MRAPDQKITKARDSWYLVKMFAPIFFMCILVAMCALAVLGVVSS